MIDHYVTTDFLLYKSVLLGIFYNKVQLVFVGYIIIEQLLVELFFLPRPSVLVMETFLY